MSKCPACYPANFPQRTIPHTAGLHKAAAPNGSTGWSQPDTTTYWDSTFPRQPNHLSSSYSLQDTTKGPQGREKAAVSTLKSTLFLDIQLEHYPVCWINAPNLLKLIQLYFVFSPTDFSVANYTRKQYFSLNQLWSVKYIWIKSSSLLLQTISLQAFSKPVMGSIISSKL